jgi:hypothetical protein
MVNYSVNGGSFVPEKPRVWIDKLEPRDGPCKFEVGG